MFLKSLKLTNFRNFSGVQLDFAAVTLLTGKNAQGKSNLLEAIYYLATTKSPRADLDMQLIKQGEIFNRTEGEVVESQEEKPGLSTRLEIVMQMSMPEVGLPAGRQGLEKRFKVNGIPRRALDYLGNLVVVHFSPEDINLVSGPPSLRRWHLDLTLAQVDKQYKIAITEYSLALSSRNKLLKRIKEGLAKLSELDFWTRKLLELGEVVAGKRREFFQVLNKQVQELSKTRSLGSFRFDYQESILSESRIREYQPREIAAAVSLIGPHRDDFIFTLNGRNLADFGSRGEQRTAVLELKLSELKFITELRNTQPVLVLDDVFSELDIEHRDYVISLVGKQQTIISAVETENIPEGFLKKVEVYKVAKGMAS